MYSSPLKIRPHSNTDAADNKTSVPHTGRNIEKSLSYIIRRQAANIHFAGEIQLAAEIALSSPSTGKNIPPKTAEKVRRRLTTSFAALSLFNRQQTKTPNAEKKNIERNMITINDQQSVPP